MISVILTFGLIGCGSESSEKSVEAIFKSGTYEGTAEGMNGPVTAVVTVSDSRIEEITFKDHKESIGISDPAFNELPGRIIEKQTIALDVISGASYSSKGILGAVKAALLLAGASEAVISREAAADEKKASEHLEYEADVVIIGAGGAGITAAYKALSAGGSVLLIEKTGAVGGNTIAAGSALNGADPDRQKNMPMSESEIKKIQAILALEPHDDWMAKWQSSVRKGLDAHIAEGATYLYDSTDLHKLQTYIGGDYVADPALVDRYCEGAAESVKFMEELGTRWKENVTAAIGATWSRSHMPEPEPWGTKGAAFVLPQWAKVQELGGQVKLYHRADTLLMDNGKVVGVSGKTAEGDTFEARAGKSVIIATGGFGANVDMRQKYNKHWPDLGPDVKTTNVPSATGDGISIALTADANLVGMEWIQLLTNADKQDFSAAINNMIYVNKEGRRYVKEDGRRDEIASATLAQTGASCYWITDTQEADGRLGGKTYAGFVINDLIDGELMFKADTIQNLAEQLEMDPAVLQQTISDYNQAVDVQSDELGRQVFGIRIEQGPFYAIYVTPKVHHTMGGIQINGNAQVIGRDGNVIPGLFAAGEVTGGIHGANRLGGNAIADIITFGRIAGEEAMK